MKLYTYFRSSAAYRVRIALALKGLPWEPIPVQLLRNGGEQFSPQYQALNPQALVPTLEDDHLVVGQSTAICEYLEENYPEPPLMPRRAADRAYVRWIMGAVASDIHPLNNLRVLNYLTGPLQLSEDAKLTWYRHWIAVGLASLEAVIRSHGRHGEFALGDSPTLADAYIVPQLYNARRFKCPLEDFPLLVHIDAACASRSEFQCARPEAQADATAT
jgi:maleylacetoacetate isomerase